MGTQSVVSVVRNGQTIVKAVAGCSGCDEREFADLISERKLTTVEEIHAAAIEFGFGCDRCTITLDKTKILGYNADELYGSLYTETFHRPKFNPRWERGTAVNTYLVHVEDWHVEECEYGDIG